MEGKIKKFKNFYRYTFHIKEDEMNFKFEYDYYSNNIWTKERLLSVVNRLENLKNELLNKEKEK